MNQLFRLEIFIPLFAYYFAYVNADCRSGEYTFQNKCYRFVTIPKTFDEAETYCQTLGYHLVSIHSAFENNFLLDAAIKEFETTDSSFRIGLNSTDRVSWTWTDGSQLDYKHWGRGEPLGSDTCAIFLTADGSWASYPCSTAVQFVCSGNLTQVRTTAVTATNALTKTTSLQAMITSAQPQFTTTTPSHISDNITCFIGIYVQDEFNQGDFVQCPPGNVCMKFNTTSSNHSVEVYACMPVIQCTTIFPAIKSGTECDALPDSNMSACCCVDQDCTSLMNRNIPPLPTPPTTQWTGPKIQCYAGLTLFDQVFPGASFMDCQGYCSSVKVKTYYNGNNLWVGVWTCIPYSLAQQANIVNSCQTLNVTIGSDDIIICSCDHKDCLSPTYSRFSNT